jgi:uncharacterized protein (DUF362 family)
VSNVEDGMVFLVKTFDRDSGIRKLFSNFDLDKFSGQQVALKANYNSADPFPASTHLQTLKTLIESLQDAGSSEITLAERSGMGDTRYVLETMGVFKLAEELGFKVVVLNEEDRDSWVKIEKERSHWLRGFYLPRVVLEADRVVQTCCLKTHRFGGNFTLSLKNSVGLVAKRLPGSLYDYMAELHISPYQRHMIAEINQYYPVDLVLMDATKAFVDRGPETGTTVEPGLLLASQDRVALDAVGVALLRYYGTTRSVSKGKIFDQAQINRAAELGVGVKSEEEIKIIPVDSESAELGVEIEEILNKG